MTHKADGLEAYRDDPGYTSPEMEPGHGEDIPPEQQPERGVLAGTGMSIGVAGGALAGELLLDEVDEEKEETTLKRGE